MMCQKLRAMSKIGQIEHSKAKPGQWEYPQGAERILPGHGKEITKTISPRIPIAKN